MKLLPEGVGCKTGGGIRESPTLQVAQHLLVVIRPGKMLPAIGPLAASGDGKGVIVQPGQGFGDNV